MSADGAKPFPKLINFNGPLPAPQTYAPPADRIISGNPQQTAHVMFTSEDGHFASGIWSCEPGKWRVVFTESEFCHILEGVLIVNGDDGSEATYRAGDAFVSPTGFTGTWHVTERAKKYFAFYD